MRCALTNCRRLGYYYHDAVRYKNASSRRALFCLATDVNCVWMLLALDCFGGILSNNSLSKLPANGKLEWELHLNFIYSSTATTIQEGGSSSTRNSNKY